MGRSYSTTRAIPNPLTVLAWQSCDHMAPVHEGDLLSSVVEVERVSMLPQGGAIVHLRSRVTAASPETARIIRFSTGGSQPFAALRTQGAIFYIVQDLYRYRIIGADFDERGQR